MIWTRDLILENPTLAWAQETALMAAFNRQIAILSGLGIPDAIMTMTTDQERTFIQQMLLARKTEVKTWRRLDVRHIGRGIEFVPFDVFAALYPGRDYLTQDVFDFITLKDQRGAVLDVALHSETIDDLLPYNENDVKLALAFRKQMVAEAEAHRFEVLTGAYVLSHEPLPRLDAELHYDALRLVILPAGMFVTLIKRVDNELWYVPFWWSPDNDINTSQVWVHTRARFALDVMLACIWRDACLVQSQAIQVRRERGKAYEGPRSDAPKHDSSVIRLPRRVYYSQWGEDGERSDIEHRTRKAHAVRGHYRALTLEQIASEDAEVKALQYGYPAPPNGWTFVSPHTRGRGDVTVTTKRIVCKGLQVAKTVLG